MDGVKLARVLRAQEGGEQLVIVLLTACRGAYQRRDAEQAGINDRLVKPIRYKQLVAMLCRIFGNSDNHRTIPTDTSVAPPASAGPAQARILLAEDNVVNQKVAAVYLHRLGYAVDVATDGTEALRAFESKEYDVILMDCHMPTMDGFAATQAIRQTGHYGRQIPIIALTADVLEPARQRCFIAGMNDVLAKPIHREALERVLRVWLEKSPRAVAPGLHVEPWQPAGSPDKAPERNPQE